ncbi:MAG: tRNA (adenosine(37)-N6)-dimethylallyltransferase MiaA [Candidatus Limnocylindria bacterium]
MSDEVGRPPLLGIVGPTASGKSELAMAVAARIPVEILVADSRQVYRGMDIGTAKPGADARALVPHHLLDLAGPDEPFTVAQWVERARELVPDIAARGRTPLLVGGSGLYVAALVNGHDYGSQGWDPTLRAQLATTLESEGLDPLVERLARAAPDVAATIDARNPRRVLRALERAAGGGEQPRREAYRGRVTLIGLERPRAVLYRRIDDRARWLFANGLLEEARELMRAGYGPDLRPMTGHGYAEAMRHLAGEWTLEEAIEVTARRTRQYAKRQLTWFRRDPRITWLAAGERPAADVAEDALRLFGDTDGQRAR